MELRQPPPRKRGKPNDPRSGRGAMQRASKAALKSQSNAYARKVDDDGSGRSSDNSGADMCGESSGDDFADRRRTISKKSQKRSFRQASDWKGQIDSMHDQQRAQVHSTTPAPAPALGQPNPIYPSLPLTRRCAPEKLNRLSCRTQTSTRFPNAMLAAEGGGEAEEGPQGHAQAPLLGCTPQGLPVEIWA